jgi:hypothetical protein
MLHNNSNEMKTVVETYIIEETAELIYDNEKLDKWNDLVSELGLSGQTKIVQKEKSPIPFMHMKPALQAVFECLCPRKVNVEAYDITPIPVEILELVALSNREGYFEKIQIWYDDKNPDPACVGVTYRNYYSHSDDGGLKLNFPTKELAQSDMNKNGWTKNKPYPVGETYYLLGKWADVKHTFDELKQMAYKRYVTEQSVDLRKKIKEAQRELDDIELTAIEKFNGGNNTDTPF